jgi:hypothetical protein
MPAIRQARLADSKLASRLAAAKKEASLVYGTYGKWLWLLRSRPDQIGHATMRRGPPSGILPAKHCARSCILAVDRYDRTCKGGCRPGDLDLNCEIRDNRHVERIRLRRLAAGSSEPLSAHNPNSSHIRSTLVFTSSVMAIGRPHSRLVSPGHLLVASIPILLPKPLTGDAKSR